MVMVDFKILIVETDDAMRRMMHTVLEGAFVVNLFKTGKEALERIDKLKPDLVMIDYQIKDISAVSLQQEIMKRKSDSTVVMISNIDRTQISLESMKRRAMDYIYRSNDPERFLNDVCKLVRYIIETKKMTIDEGMRTTGYYALAKKLYEEKKWTVEDIKRALQKLENE
jgi:DNA-binding NtrC family response regulator